MLFKQISKRKTAVPNVWSIKAGNTKIGTVRTKQLTETQRTWSGSFAIPLADGTKVKISVKGLHTAAQVNKAMLKEFKAGKHGKVGFSAAEKCITARKAKPAAEDTAED